MCENMSSCFKVMERTHTHTHTHRKDENIIPPWHTSYAGGIKSKYYPRERRERRKRHYRFRPADVTFFTFESDKNVALIFNKVRYLSFPIYTCHQLRFDLGQSSTRYPSGLHKKSIRGRGPTDVSRKNLDGFAMHMR